MRRSRSDDSEDAAPKAIVPVDQVNESVVIAAVCVDKKAADELLPVYSKEFFYARGHARIWEILQEMQRRGLYYDPATLIQMSGGDIDLKYVESLREQRPTRPPNLKHHVEHLAQDRARVEATRGPIAGLLDLLKDPTTPYDRLRAMAKRIPEALEGYGSSTYIKRGSSVAETQRGVIAARSKGNACYSYGIEDLDLLESDHRGYREPRMVPGSSPGTITLVTGVSGSGKSTLTAASVLGMVMSGRKILMGSWEQGDGSTLELMAAMHIGMSRTDLMSGRYNENDQARLGEAMEEIAVNVDFFHLPFGKARGEKQFNDKAIDLIEQVIADSRAEVFVADLMRRAFKETDPDDEEQALFRLQAAGQRLNIHQIWVHQQRLKDVENRVDRRPTREGMKGSSAWVEVPDTIIGVHRQALWKNVPDDRIELIILKQRWGKWPLAVEFDWDSEFASIESGRSIVYEQRGESNDLDQVLERGSKRRG